MGDNCFLMSVSFPLRLGFSVNVSCVASAAKETTNVSGGFRSNSFPMVSMKMLSLMTEARAKTARA